MCLMLFSFRECTLCESDVVGSSSITEYVTVDVSKANHSMHHYHKTYTNIRDQAHNGARGVCSSGETIPQTLERQYRR